MTRIGLAMVWMAAVWGQSRFEISVRMSMRTEVDGKETVRPEETLATQRISVRGEMVRVDVKEKFAIRDVGTGRLVIARESDKTYVRTTATAVADVMADYEKVIAATMARSKPQLEMMTAPAAPPFSWNGHKTEATNCRFRTVVQVPNMKAAPAPVTTMHIYSVPTSAELEKGLAAQEGLGIAAKAGLAGDMSALADCQPKGQTMVRSLVLSDIDMTTPVRMRMRSEIVMDVKLLAGEPAAEEFTVPADWKEGPAESVRQRVVEFVGLPAAIQ